MLCPQRENANFSGLATRAPVHVRAMADAPPWMTPLEIEGALQPGKDCEEAYLFLEKGRSIFNFVPD